MDAARFKFSVKITSEQDGRLTQNRGAAIRGCGDATPFHYLAHLPNINSARERCIADKTQGKSYLSANWGCAP